MIATLLLCTLAAPGETAPLHALPAAVELGERAPGSRSDADVWLWNRGDAPLRVTAARPACGCTALPDFAPLTLAAGEAAPVALRVVAPGHGGETKETSVSFVVEGHVPLRVPVRVAAAGADAPEDADTGQVRPEDVDTDDDVAPRGAHRAELAWQVTGALEGAPGETVEGSLWLLWHGETPRAALAAKPACGCTTLDEVPEALDARRPLELPFRLRLPAEPGVHRKAFRVTAGGGAPAEVPLRVHVRAPGA